MDLRLSWYLLCARMPACASVLSSEVKELLRRHTTDRDEMQESERIEGLGYKPCAASPSLTTGSASAGRAAREGVAVCAPTGIAAVNIGGITLHSWAGPSIRRGNQ